MKTKLNVAVCGLGWWGSKILRNCNNHPSIGFLAACDPDDQLRQEMEKEYSVKGFESLEDASRENRIDAAFVITPPETHYPLVKAALEQGIHVVVAKPPTLTLEETEDLIRIAEDKKLILMTDATFCYSPPMKKIKEVLNSGDLGKVTHVKSIRFGDNLRVQGYKRLEDAMKGTGTDVILDLVLHDLAILTYLFGAGFAVQAVSKSATLFDGLCDTADIILDSRDMNAHIALSWIMTERARKLVIFGEKAILTWDDLSPDRRLWIMDTKGENEKVFDLDDSEPLYSMIEHFINSIRSGDEPNTGPSLMKHSMKILKKIEES